MRRFVPPSIDTLELAPVMAGESDPLAAIRDAGYREGFLAGKHVGHAEGFAQAEAQTREAWAKDVGEWRNKLEEQNVCSTVAHGLAQLLAARSADYLTLTRQTRAAIASALHLLFPTLMARAIGGEIRAIVEEALTARSTEGLVLRASAETIATITAQGLPADEATRVRLRPTPDYPPNKVDISWSGGGLSFDPEILLGKVSDALMADPMRKDDEDE